MGHLIYFMQDYQALAKDALFPFIDPLSLGALFRTCKWAHEAFWAEMSPILRAIICLERPLDLMIKGPEYAKYWLPRAHKRGTIINAIMTDNCEGQNIDAKIICEALGCTGPEMLGKKERQALISMAYEVRNFDIFVALYKDEIMMEGHNSRVFLDQKIMGDMFRAYMDHGTIVCGLELSVLFNSITSKKVRFLEKLAREFEPQRLLISELINVIRTNIDLGE